MGSIRERPLKNGGTRYQAEVRLKGHPTLTAMFDRKTDAKTWIQKTEAGIRCGRQQLYPQSKRKTLTDAIERYFKEQKVSIAKKGHLNWWQKELGNFYLQDIRPSVITEKKQKLLSERNSKGKIRTGATCNRFLATLSHLMSICYKQWEWISENPICKISREKESRERTRFLSSEERIRFLEACRESQNPHLFLFAILLLSTGCRYNEIRQLKWTEVDLERGKITITKSKNSDIRSVPIRGFALNQLRLFARSIDSLGFVFPGKKPFTPLEFRRALKTAIKRAGLENFRPHDCRHSYATEMLAQGISLGEIGHLLGHRSVSMTRRYAHLVESRSIEAVSKMSEQIFQGIMNG